MLVRRLTVENVRSFLEPATLELDGRISILIGPNGGGKTNLLDIVVIVLRRHLFASQFPAHAPTPEQPERYEMRYNDQLNVTVGRCLYLNVTPTGGRSWHCKFYFEGKCQKLMLGTYPEISLECAKSRHQYARNLIAQGINPCEMKATLGKHAFVRRLRDWEIANCPRPEYSAGRTMAGI